MAQGQANRPLESADGTAIDVNKGEASVRARTVEELLAALLEEVQEIKVLLAGIIG